MIEITSNYSSCRIRYNKKMSSSGGSMQHKITRPSRLLDKHGKLKQKGYATVPLLKYRRKDVAKKSRLKEWDYYLIINKEYALALTVAKSLNLVLINVTLIHLKSKTIKAKTSVKITSARSFRMPESSCRGDVIIKKKNINLAFRLEDNIRILLLNHKDFRGQSDLDLSLVLYNEPKDSMVIGTPFKEDKRDFYYNRKIVGMRVSGYVRYQNHTELFSPVSSFGILDWGRGVWPYKTTWYWSAGQSMINGRIFGFNLGYGFGDTSTATENMLFYDGIAHKLTDVTFHIPKDKKAGYDYLKPWTITSSDHRIEMIFVPMLDRSTNLSAVVLSTNQHQVFGYFSGTAILDDGTMLHIKDLLGFAERVVNRW